ALNNLKQAIKLCKEEKAKEFHSFVSLNKKSFQFFMKYPSLYKEMSEDKKFFINKDLKASKDIFGSLFWVGINTCDLLNDSVLDHLDTALLMTKEGKGDLQRGGFF